MSEKKEQVKEEIGKGATLLKSDRRIIGAITLIMYNDLECDLRSGSDINGVNFPVNTNMLGSFKAFLEDLCNGIIFSEVIAKYIKVEVEKSKQKEPSKDIIE